jgi:hypothetical protein
MGNGTREWVTEGYWVNEYEQGRDCQSPWYAIGAPSPRSLASR